MEDGPPRGDRRELADRRFKELISTTARLLPEVAAQYPQFALTPFVEIEAFHRACLEEGSVLLDHPCVRQPVWLRGFEHEVWREGESKVIKATYSNCFGATPWGLPATPIQYLTRLRLCNAFFSDSIEFLGLVAPAGSGIVRALTSQDFVEGTEPTQVETDEYLASLGFEKNTEKERTIWTIPWRNHTACVADLHPKNVRRIADGRLVVIDGIVAVRLEGGESRRRVKP